MVELILCCGCSCRRNFQATANERGLSLHEVSCDLNVGNIKIDTISWLSARWGKDVLKRFLKNLPC